MKTNTEFKHTPGVMCRQGPFGEWCFRCKCLLSAAPELLEAAKEVYGYDAWAAAVDNKALAGALGILRAAVVKAEGK